MKTIIKSLTTGFLAGLACLALCGTARADLSLSNSTTTASWNQVSGQNPIYVTSLSGLSAQGQPSAGSGATYTVLSETFTITNNGAGSLANGNTNYVLTGVAIMGGAQPANSSIHIYDVTTNLTTSAGTILNGQATYNFAANGDLLGNGNGLSFTNNGVAGEDQVLFNLSSGPLTQDQIVLGARHTYTVEFWTPTSGGFSWYRSSNVDPGGEAMGGHDSSLGVARPTINSLGLAGAYPRTFALALYGTITSAPPSVNNNTNNIAVTNYMIDAFNPKGFGPTNIFAGTNDYSVFDQITNVWNNWFGSSFSNLVWDSSNDANGNASSGAMKITANFSNGGQFVVWDGANGITPALSALSNGFSSFQCDVRFDPSSPVTVNSGTLVTNYGHLQFGTQIGGASSQYFFSPAIEVPVGTTNWVHVSIPVSISDPNLLTINDVAIKIDGGWYGSTPLNGVTILWVDNIKFVAPSNYIMPPPPILTIQKASPGLRMFAGSTVNTYDRVELATIDNQQSWVGGSFPKSYSFKLLDYPANIYQTHIFLVPQNTSGQANMGNVNGSVNEYIEYQASNTLWMVLGPGSGGVVASVQWKTNQPNANPTNTVVQITNSTAVGTWTLTFNSATTGTLTAPGASPVAFSLPSAVAAQFANPLVAYFGLQPNSSTGMGQYEDWASITVAGVAGVNENDNFMTDSSFNNSLWSINTSTVALNSCVQLVTASTPYWAFWTHPAINYDLGTARNVTALRSSNTPDGWVLPEYYNSYNDGSTIPNEASQGNKTWVLMPSTCLPTVNGAPGGALSPKAFFQLFSPPLAN